MAFEPSGIRASSIVGRVVAPAEEKFDGRVVELRIAIGHGFKDKTTGEWKETGTTWLTYVATGEWGDALKEFDKGSLVKISDASIETKTYERKQGGEGLQVTARFGTIELLESKRELAETAW